MTHDAETVERVERALWTENQCDVSYDEALLGAERGHGHDIAALNYNNDLARAALSALPPQEVSVHDAAKVLLGEMSPMTEKDAYGKAHSLISYTNGYNAALRDIRALSEKPHE